MKRSLPSDMARPTGAGLIALPPAPSDLVIASAAASSNPNISSAPTAAAPPPAAPAAAPPEAAADAPAAEPVDAATTAATAAKPAAAAPAAASAPSSSSEPKPLEPFAAPEEAGAVSHAQLWYYRDAYGQEQGPQPAASMRHWFLQGYFDGGVQVAPTYYGEVPVAFWPMDQLWRDPKADAFVLADGAGDGTFVGQVDQSAVTYREPFMPCAHFAGYREGYVFKTDEDYGTGYFLDAPPKPEVNAMLLEAEKEIVKAKAMRLNSAFHMKGEGPT